MRDVPLTEGLAVSVDDDSDLAIDSSVGCSVGPANFHKVVVIESEEDIMDRLSPDLIEHSILTDRGWRTEGMKHLIPRLSHLDSRRQLE